MSSELRPFDLLLPHQVTLSYHKETISQGFVGRPSLALIPGVVDYIEDVLFMTSAAQNRRRTNEKTTIGISLADLNTQLLDLFPAVRRHFPNLQNETIRRLGQPPCKAHLSAALYHNAIAMRQMGLENNQFVFDNSSHDSFAQVSLICEQFFLAQGVGDLVTMISMDDGAEEHLGQDCTFTSRYHQLRRMSSTLHPPTCSSHDFYDDKLTPSAYLILTPKPPTTLNADTHPLPAGHYQTYVDDQKRLRVKVPNDGPLHVFYSAPKLFPVTLASHLSHIDQISPPTSFLAIMSDKATDNSFELDGNAVTYGRYWQEKKLDGLIVLSYKISAFNKVEHKFSPWKKQFTGCSFPLETEKGILLSSYSIIHFLGEKPKSDEEFLQCYNSVISQVIKIGSKLVIAGFPTKVYNANEKCTKFADHAEWNLFLTKSKRNYTSDDQAKLVIYQFLVRHLVISKWYLLFLRCDDSSCEHCSKLPATRSPFLLNLLKEQGGRFPFPTVSKENPSSFYCFSQLYELNLYNNRPQYRGAKEREYCDDCNCYLFFSYEQKKRHWKLVHHGQPTQSYLTGQHECHHLVNGAPCNLKFDTQQLLEEHKRAQGHKKELTEKQRASIEKRKLQKQQEKRETTSAEKNERVDPPHAIRTKTNKTFLVPPPDGSDLTPYERERKENIERGKQKLAELGLNGPILSNLEKPKKHREKIKKSIKKTTTAVSSPVAAARPIRRTMRTSDEKEVTNEVNSTRFVRGSRVFVYFQMSKFTLEPFSGTVSEVSDSIPPEYQVDFDDGDVKNSKVWWRADEVFPLRVTDAPEKKNGRNSRLLEINMHF